MMVGVVGLFNGFGRLAWATLSDPNRAPADVHPDLYRWMSRCWLASLALQLTTALRDRTYA